MSAMLLPTTLSLFRWNNPQTTCEYPYLAVSDDRGLFLSLGNERLCFEWTVPPDAVEWLAKDYVATGDSISVDFSTVKLVLRSLYPGGTDFCMVTFYKDTLRARRLSFSLQNQIEADDGPEFFIDEDGTYQRLFRLQNKSRAVTEGERALLEVCEAMMRGLTTDYRELMTEPPPPRYRKDVPFKPPTGYLS